MELRNRLFMINGSRRVGRIADDKHIVTIPEIGNLISMTWYPLSALTGREMTSASARRANSCNRDTLGQKRSSSSRRTAARSRKAPEVPLVMTHLVRQKSLRFFCKMLKFSVEVHESQGYGHSKSHC